MPRESLARNWVDKEKKWIAEKLAARGDNEIEIVSIQQFRPTAPGPDGGMNPRDYRK